MTSPGASTTLGRRHATTRRSGCRCASKEAQKKPRPKAESFRMVPGGEG